jgi:hypothetical protein
MRLDETDLKLLRVLQEGAREPIKTLAERIALSHNGTLHRLKRLEGRTRTIDWCGRKRRAETPAGRLRTAQASDAG